MTTPVARYGKIRPGDQVIGEMMHSRGLLATVAMAAILCVGCAQAPKTTNTNAKQISSGMQAGFVHQSGMTLVDGNDAPLKLTGFNLGGWLEWEGWIWGASLDYVGESDMMSHLTDLVGSSQAQEFQANVESNFITQADFNALASDGFNVVRVPFNYMILSTQPNTYKSSGWSILDNVVAEARKAHVYVVLDMHDAPCGQSQLFTANYTGGPTLWQSSQCQNETVAIWKAIASRYEGNTDILGYDLLNEPSTGNAELLSMYQRITAAVRQVDKNHLLIYEGNSFATDFSVFTKRLDANQMLSFHAYTWINVSSKLNGYNHYANSLDVPLYAGEYGALSSSGLSKYAQGFRNDPHVFASTMWTWKEVPGRTPTAQLINESPDAQMLIDWMNNTNRARPSLSQAEQGMKDFAGEIEWQNTTTDRQTLSALR